MGIIEDAMETVNRFDRDKALEAIGALMGEHPDASYLFLIIDGEEQKTVDCATNLDSLAAIGLAHAFQFIASHELWYGSEEDVEPHQSL